MNNYQGLPSYLKPLSPWAYFGLSILYAIPIVGFIFLLFHAIGSANVNKRNYARSYFCTLALVLILVLVLALTGGLAALASAF